MCEITKQVIETIFIGGLVGTITGLYSSWLVSKAFRKKAFLDQAMILLKRLCPYRRHNVRDGDGLEETGWALRILGSVLIKANFKKEGVIIEDLGKVIGEIQTLNPETPETKGVRDELKDSWAKEIENLY